MLLVPESRIARTFRSVLCRRISLKGGESMSSKLCKAVNNFSNVGAFLGKLGGALLLLSLVPLAISAVAYRILCHYEALHYVELN